MSFHLTSTMSNSASNVEGIEIAGRTVEKMLHGDGQFPALQDKLRVGKEDRNSLKEISFFDFNVRNVISKL